MNIQKHIIPFLWTHGENQEQMRSEIDAIYRAGIREFCLESRPHPKFCEEAWWEDFGNILTYAKTKDMGVWLLDAKHYPSGTVEGYYEKHPELLPKRLRLFFCDVFAKEGYVKALPHYKDKSDCLYAAFLCPVKNGEVLYADGIDVTEFLNNDMLVMTVAEGYYRICFLYITTACAERESLSYYMDVLNPQSTGAIITEVYEPHYRYFSEYFGTTFRGFFSDEPRFSNGISEWNWSKASFYNTKLGQVGVSFPYSEELFEKMDFHNATDILSLWLDVNEQTPQIRTNYMNLITLAYEKNYSMLLGDWCRSRGISFIGHIVEDMGTHTRLGSGAGHYFRAIRGQDMAGIDVVFHQILPYYSNVNHISLTSAFESDSTFFSYAMAKLGVSSAKLDARKQGRTMCEMFGAYGWGETVVDMKWIIDLMLVSGVNYFVPHAFSPDAFDVDCPPHFYRGGKNPQYAPFSALMGYTERVAEKISGGQEKALVAILYHNEAEWSGRPFEPCDKLAKLLTQNQIPFDIVDLDSLQLKQDYNVLLVPYGEYVTANTQAILHKLSSRLRVVYCEVDENFASLTEKVDLSELRAYSLKHSDTAIRIYRYEKEKETLYLLFNDSAKEVSNTLLISEYQEKNYCIVNPMTGTKETGIVSRNGEVEFSLSAGELVLLEFHTSLQLGKQTYLSSQKFNGKIEVSFSYDGIHFEEYKTVEACFDFTAEEKMKDFCGILRYEFTLNCKQGEQIALNFGTLDNAISLKVNDCSMGYRYGNPFEYEITDVIVEGTNHITVDFYTTLLLKERDIFSSVIGAAYDGLKQIVIKR